MNTTNFLALIVFVTLVNCVSSDGDIDSAADTDFFDQNYVDGIKTTDDYLDPEADIGSDTILSRKSRSLLATGLDGRRRTRKGKGQDKGDYRYLITDQRKDKDCIHVYTEKIVGKLQLFKEVDDPSGKGGRVLQKLKLYNITITPNNVQNAENNCPELTKAKTSGQITIPLIDDNNKNLKVTIKLNLDVFRGQYWELTSKSEVTVEGEPGKHVLKVHHPNEITAGTQFSYSCSSLAIKSPKAKVNGTLAELKLTMDRFHVQPYGTFKQNARAKVFRPSFDCSTWFTVPLWTGFLVVLLFTAILAMGVIALLDIKTMDRFENPKGKTITIAAATD